jgi:hypothetical protein
MWDNLKLLKTVSDLPWMVMGNFNEGMWQQEHFSCTPRAENQMVAFREALAVCKLIYLGFKGLLFTNDNKRKGRVMRAINRRPLGTPRGGCDAYSSTFSLRKKPRFIEAGGAKKQVEG